MNDLPRQKLSEIIATYSKSVCDDARLCEGLLRDLCGGYKRETHVLISALRERVPHELLNNASSGVSKEVTIARLLKRLHDELAMTEEAARWAVESWALALGVMTTAEITKLAANKPLVAPKMPPSQVIPAPRLQPYSAPDPNQSPEIRGFRLGMNLGEVLEHFKGLQAKSADEIGFQKVRLDVNQAFTTLLNTERGAYVSKAISSSLEGLKALEFEFLDERISSLHLEYDGSVKWNSVDEFANKISETIDARGKWLEPLGYRGQDTRRLTTPNYWIEVVGGWRQTLHLQDIQAERIIKERTASKEDHQRRTFNI